MVDFAADSLILPQTAEEADLSGEHLVVGNLVHQLLTWEQQMKISSFLSVNGRQ